MIIISLALVVLIFLVYNVKFDPADDELLINEQSLNLSAKMSKKFRDIVDINKLREEFFMKEVPGYAKR